MTNELLAAKFDEALQAKLIDTDNPFRVNSLIDTIKNILVDIRPDQLPPKDTVIAYVREGLAKIFVVVDFPGPDKLIEPLIELFVTQAVSRLYDRLVRE